MLWISGHLEVEIHSPQRVIDEKISCPSLVSLRHCEHSLVNICQQIGINVIRYTITASCLWQNHWAIIIDVKHCDCPNLWLQLI